MPHWRIGEILIQKNLISWEQLEEVLEEQKNSNELTGQILVRKRYVSDPLLYQALAEQHDMRYVDLKRTRINPKAVEMVPRSIAAKYAIIPIEIHHNTLLIGISNPQSAWPEFELKQLTRITDIRAVLCLPADVEQAIHDCYGEEEEKTVRRSG